MTETALQAFLRHGGTPADLAAQYAIKATQHRRYPHLWSFKYDQIRSDMRHRICQEARGSVLNAAQHWAYVARAWDKFWNVGEGLAAPINWAYARVQEKIDGSLCIVYWYDGTWQVATSGSPDASGLVYGTDRLTFANLFWGTAHERLLMFGEDARAYTWLFELTSPLNRIVVRHGVANLTLIGARETATGRELPVREADRLIGVTDIVREFPLQSWDQVQATFAHLSPLTQEGYVIVSYDPATPPGQQFPRVKVKHPGYVALHHMRDRFTPRGLVEVVRHGEIGEVLAAFPELTELIRIAARYEALCQEIDADWEALAARWPDNPPSRKEFAAAALRTRCPAALFARLDGKAPAARSFLAAMAVDRLLALLDLSDADAPVLGAADG